jgi:hypothetical protein
VSLGTGFPGFQINGFYYQPVSSTQFRVSSLLNNEEIAILTIPTGLFFTGAYSFNIVGTDVYITINGQQTILILNTITNTFTQFTSTSYNASNLWTSNTSPTATKFYSINRSGATSRLSITNKSTGVVTQSTYTIGFGNCSVYRPLGGTGQGEFWFFTSLSGLLGYRIVDPLNDTTLLFSTTTNVFTQGLPYCAIYNAEYDIIMAFTRSVSNSVTTMYIIDCLSRTVNSTYPLAAAGVSSSMVWNVIYNQFNNDYWCVTESSGSIGLTQSFVIVVKVLSYAPPLTPFSYTTYRILKGNLPNVGNLNFLAGIGFTQYGAVIPYAPITSNTLPSGYYLYSLTP